MENQGISSFVKLLGPSGAFVKLLVLSGGEWWAIQWNTWNAREIKEIHGNTRKYTERH